MVLLAKTRGGVGCAHCQELAATTAPCDICRRLICRRCGEDTLESCPEPAAPGLAMGLGRRLLCVDEQGRLALVFGLNARVLDLQRRCWVAFNPTAHRLQMGPWPVLGAVGLVSASDPRKRWEVLVVDELRPGGLRHEIAIHAATAISSLTLCDQGTHAVLIGDGKVRCYDLRARASIFSDEVPASVAAFSSTDGSLVTGLEELLALYRVRGTRAEVFGAARLESAVTWLSISGGRIAALVEGGDLLAWSLPAGIAQSPIRVRSAAITHPALASLSADGKLVAVAEGKSIQVHDLESSTTQLLEGHELAVTFVRFARGGDWLVSAAANNEVIQWPRRPGGFVDHVVKVKLPRAVRDFPGSDPRPPLLMGPRVV